MYEYVAMLKKQAEKAAPVKVVLRPEGEKRVSKELPDYVTDEEHKKAKREEIWSKMKRKKWKGGGLQKSFVKSFRKISNWLHEINIYETYESHCQRLDYFFHLDACWVRNVFKYDC